MNIMRSAKIGMNRYYIALVFVNYLLRSILYRALFSLFVFFSVSINWFMDWFCNPMLGRTDS